MKKLALLFSLVIVCLASFGFIIMKKNNNQVVNTVEQEQLVVIKKEARVHTQEAGL